jgi:hypothetical protein
MPSKNDGPEPIDTNWEGELVFHDRLGWLPRPLWDIYIEQVWGRVPGAVAQIKNNLPPEWRREGKRTA